MVWPWCRCLINRFLLQNKMLFQYVFQLFCWQLNLIVKKTRSYLFKASPFRCILRASYTRKKLLRAWHYSLILLLRFGKIKRILVVARCVQPRSESDSYSFTWIWSILEIYSIFYTMCSWPIDQPTFTSCAFYVGALFILLQTAQWNLCFASTRVRVVSLASY